MNIKNLKDICQKNLGKIVIGHLNINSIRQKLDSLIEITAGNIDVLMISEAKLDDSFPKGQFLIKGFSEPYRLDLSSKGGGIMLFIREDIPSKLLSIEQNSIESFYIEVNLRKVKWLLSCSYNPNKNNIHAHLENLDRSLTLYSSSYENYIIMGDFNVGPENTYIRSFCDNFYFTNLIKEPTCFKNPENPSCIDLIFTNRSRGFQNSCAIETGLSDFHKMTLTVMEKSFQKYKPRITKFRAYRHF